MGILPIIHYEGRYEENGSSVLGILKSGPVREEVNGRGDSREIGCGGGGGSAE